MFKFHLYLLIVICLTFSSLQGLIVLYCEVHLNILSWLPHQVGAVRRTFSRIKQTLSHHSFMRGKWSRREKGGGGGGQISSACLPEPLGLIALLLTKCWCNYKKDTFLLFLLMRVTLASAWTEVRKPRSYCSSLWSHAPTLCFVSYPTSPQHATLRGKSSKPSWEVLFVQALSRCTDYLSILVSEEQRWCLGGSLSSHSLPGLKWV